MYRIVVVEDEEIVRKGLVITTDWESYDCQVIGEAKNGGEGLSLITKLKPDIVITDIRMPVMDGLQMIEKVYETYMPVTIMITAFNEFEYAKKGIDLSVSDYLLKPFDDAQLDKALKRAIEKVNNNILLCSVNKDTDKAALMEEIDKKLRLTVNSKHINIIKAIEYIKENYMKEINILSTSEYLKVSESYLSHLFKKETGYTFVELLTLTRLKKACKLLKDPQARISEVAYMVGYRDQRYFGNIFKKHFGVTPNYYKERM